MPFSRASSPSRCRHERRSAVCASVAGRRRVVQRPPSKGATRACSAPFSPASWRSGSAGRAAGRRSDRSRRGRRRHRPVGQRARSPVGRVHRSGIRPRCWRSATRCSTIPGGRPWWPCRTWRSSVLWRRTLLPRLRPHPRARDEWQRVHTARAVWRIPREEGDAAAALRTSPVGGPPDASRSRVCSRCHRRPPSLSVPRSRAGSPVIGG